MSSVIISFINQPTGNGKRWRYLNKNRESDPIKGEHSDYPEIKISCYEELKAKHVFIVVSLVTKDLPFYTHPYCLVGKGCHSVAGLFCKAYKKRELNEIICLPDLSIVRIPIANYENILTLRKEHNIDPFGVTFPRSHFSNKMFGDGRSVRLCVQVVARCDGEDKTVGRVVSNPIFEHYLVRNRIRNL